MRLYKPNPGLVPWLPAASLGFAAFIFVTTELLPVGLLPDISTDLGMAESTTGILLTVYAWVVAAMSLPLTVLTASINRRTLVMALLALFIVGNAIAAMAGNFTILLCARICIALCHAVFWSIATPLATRVAPRGKRAKALSIIVTFTSLATVLGIPLGTLFGHNLGWRAAFAAVALIAFAVLLVLRRFMPSEPSSNTGSFKSLPELARCPQLRKLFLLTLLTVVGHFTVFTYFSPYMTQIGGFTGQSVAFLLLIAGGAGIFGSWLGSRFAEQWDRASLAAPLAALAGLFLLMPLARSGFVAAGALCFFWGTAWTFVTLAFQLRVLACSTNFADVSIAIYSGTFNIGIGGGALLGSRIFADAGVLWLGFTAAAFMAASCVISLLPMAARQCPPQAEENQPETGPGEG